MKNLLLVLAFILLRFSVAQACSCVGERISEKKKIAKAYKQDALIFTGRVLRADTRRAGDTLHGRSQFSGVDTVYTLRQATVRYTFAVSRLLKGPAGAATVTVSARTDGSACGKVFRLGTDYLVHAYLLDQEQSLSGNLKRIPPYFATGLCQRTKELRATRRAELRQLARLAARG